MDGRSGSPRYRPGRAGRPAASRLPRRQRIEISAASRAPVARASVGGDLQLSAGGEPPDVAPMPVQDQPDEGDTEDDHGPPHGAPQLPANEVKRDQADEADRNSDQRGERRQPGETDDEEPAD